MSKCFMRSLALMPSLSASSLTVAPSLSGILVVGRVKFSTLPETGAACLRTSRRFDGGAFGDPSSSVSGIGMSGPRSSLMICVPENGPFVNNSLSTSDGRSLLPRLPVVFFLGDASSLPSGRRDLLRPIAPPGSVPGSGGGADGPAPGRPTPGRKLPDQQDAHPSDRRDELPVPSAACPWADERQPDPPARHPSARRAR